MGVGLPPARDRVHRHQPPRDVGFQGRRHRSGGRLCHRRARAHDQRLHRVAGPHAARGLGRRRPSPAQADRLRPDHARVHLHDDHEHLRAPRRHHHRLDVHRVGARDLDRVARVAESGAAPQGVSLRRRLRPHALDRHLCRRGLPCPCAAPPRPPLARREGGGDPPAPPDPRRGADRVPRGSLR